MLEDAMPEEAMFEEAMFEEAMTELAKAVLIFAETAGVTGRTGGDSLGMTLAAAEGEPACGRTLGGVSNEDDGASLADASDTLCTGGGVNGRYTGAFDSATSASIAGFETGTGFETGVIWAVGAGVSGAPPPEARTSIISRLGLSK
jgi:hypothetical protein